MTELSTWRASVDDPVRIYLREIGRTPLLKLPQESAFAEKMALGRQARIDLELLNQSMTTQGNTQSGPDRALPTLVEGKRREFETLIMQGEQAKQQLVSG